MAENNVEFVKNFFRERPFLKNGIKTKEDLGKVLFGKPQKKEQSDEVKNSTEFDQPKED